MLASAARDFNRFQIDIGQTFCQLSKINHSNMKYILALAMLSLVLVGCTTPGHLHPGDPAKISVGMTKEEVFRRVGNPESRFRDGEADVLGYHLEGGGGGDFQIRILDGKVDSYGLKNR